LAGDDKFHDAHPEHLLENKLTVPVYTSPKQMRQPKNTVPCITNISVMYELPHSMK